MKTWEFVAGVFGGIAILDYLTGNRVSTVAFDTIALQYHQTFGTKYDTYINASAESQRINPSLLFRLLYKESAFREDIITGKTKSRTGAMGIAQFMPNTAREWLGAPENALKPELAIVGAARYLGFLIDYFDGDIRKGVAAYNWGIGNVEKYGLENAPSETKDYVTFITWGLV